MSGYPQFLRYFMWEWQVYFRISCQTRAESLFNNLDNDLQPFTFLVGISANKAGEQICIEPEELMFSTDDFSNVQEIADKIYDEDPDRNMFYTGKGMQEEMDGRRKQKSFKLALEKKLNKSVHNAGNIHFAAEGVLVKNYFVFIILCLNQAAYDSQVFLHHLDLEERLKMYYSLLESTVTLYLKTSRLELFLPDPGKNLSFDLRPVEEILREGAQMFMSTVAWAGKKVEGIHLLFNACNNISVSRYERLENLGVLIIVEKNHVDIEMILELKEPFSIRNYRQTRKMLQLSNSEIGVICNSAEILGLGKIRPGYNKADESIFKVEFQGTHCWNVLHDQDTLFLMRYGVPEFPKEIINKQLFFKDAKRIFPKVKEKQLNILHLLSTVTAKQAKGAILIFIEDAKEEVKRLSKQCLSIKPVKLNEELVTALTIIDGGIILDLDGFVHAKGVILDGLAGHRGDASRGSRYNSAVTYQEHRGLNKPTLLLVVSEDGMVDIIPSLMPQIRHSEIIQVIGVLEKLTTEKDFNSKAFYNSMNWLRNRAFYLTKMECKRINKLKEDLQELDKKSGERSMWFIHEDLYPNPEMNDTYYASED